MKNYSEEWTVIINKNKYVLNENQAMVLKEAIARGNRGMILFPEFSINIAYVEEFYLSGKIYDKNIKIDYPKEQEISEEERKRVRQKIEEFKKKFINKSRMPGGKLSEQEINSRRNKLLDQAETIN